MAVIKYDKKGQLYEAAQSNMGFIGKGLYPVTDSFRRSIVLNSMSEIEHRDEIEHKRIVAEKLSARIQEKRRLEEQNKIDETKKRFQAEVLRNDAMVKRINTLKSQPLLEAVMQGADYNNTEYLEYPSNLPRDPRSDWEGYKAGVPFDMPVDTRSGMKQPQFGSVLSDWLGVNVDAARQAEIRAKEEAAKAILGPQPAPAPIVLPPAAANFFQQYKTYIMIGGAVLAGLVVIKVLKK